MATSLRPDELSTTTRHFLSKESMENVPDFKNVAQNSNYSVKQDSIIKLPDVQQNTAFSDCTDTKDVLSDLGTTSNTEMLHLKEDPVDRTLDSNESLPNANFSMNSVSGWYGKGCSRLRKRKKGSALTKRAKKE